MEFLVIANPRVPLSTPKEHCSNRSYNSPLSRRVDRILPIQLKIEHLIDKIKAEETNNTIKIFCFPKECL